MERAVDVTESGVGVRRVMIRRPPANALDIAAVRSLEEVFRDLGRDPPERGVVLTGAGEIFCAGDEPFWDASSL
jgi:enoyl-CoA hydratase/carnithine racemase